ncbi:SpoIIE family protein phosphatase/ATP-binding protein [Streptomyces sp. ICBB 8177]|uniref:SpoIIE family protein phosphatase/ATP-binding protein n=1 Tax=Streptomyces sp. ICBB 8177 TaxID=563922 RepID=UPI000D67337D|nr:SpoIIE family protein phosphatase/ATP-binding protein [Streptomyces sp. ICBB 8177]PWI41661.1 histidine kinase [Streptomyces sp. ICBB 8177]
MPRFRGRSWAPSARRATDRRPRGRPDHPSRAGSQDARERRVRRPDAERRRWLGLSVRSLAGQVFVLQVVIVLLLIAAAVGELVAQSHHDSTQEARNRSLAVAQTFANSPGIVAALASKDPTAILQPKAQQVRATTGVDFLVVTNTKGIRYTHPIRNRIGKKFVGDISQPLAGHPVTQTVNGTIGRLVQAVVPVFDARGKVVGLVSAGITISKISNVTDRQLPILLSGAILALGLSTAGTALVSRRLRRQTHGLGPAEMTRMYEHHDAVLHSVREGVLIVGEDGRVLLANDEARRLLDLPPDVEGRPLDELGLPGQLAELLRSGSAVTDEVFSAGPRLLATNIRSTDRDGGPPGTVATLRDSTELRALTGKADQARGRLRLLHDASMAIGTTLDVRRTAEELTRVAAPSFADYVTVDLAEGVLLGEEPTPGEAMQLRRVASGGVRDDAPLYPVGQTITFAPSTPQANSLRTGRAELEPSLADAPDWQAQDLERTRQVIDYGIHSLIAVPLRARGAVLGVANFWRSEQPAPFEDDDRSLAEELVAHAALCVDNARRYTREHAMAVTLQHSLLPRGLPEQNALEVAYRYLPAQAGVGGDWFDVIPLPGSRVALVVGDVVGHGLHAAATMGRLRTAVHNFSSLDVPPDELLGHLDELVNRIDQETPAAGDEAAITGATCLYATYDPASRRCVIARAGHPPPAVVHPDGRVEFAEVPAGPPLGLAVLPFETTEVFLEEGSRLVLYTDGLVENRDEDIDVGLERLRGVLAEGERTPDETCSAVLDSLLPAHQRDDIALLVARTRVLRPDQIADWEVPSDPAAVGTVRADVTRKLEEWGLEDLAFTTELILSELITNAIRYATGPIRVRLLRDRRLTCEVSDTSSTAPHLRYAASTDEGGRGLFLVAQFAERWGTRYTPEGKVIWTEQQLEPSWEF